jgi:hypothetical protein
MSSAYTCNKQFNFRELSVAGLQVWSKISGRSLMNNLNKSVLDYSLGEHQCWKEMNQLHLNCQFLHTCFNNVIE